MAMTLQERVSACSRDTAFTRKIIGALSKQAKWVLRAGEQPEAQVGFAWKVLRAPDAFAYRFGIAALTEPFYDGATDADTIPDADVQGTVSELWGIMTASEFEA